MFIYGVPNLGIPLRHILGQIAARPRSTLTPVSNHGFTDPLAAESLENMNKKLGFESVGFLTDGFYSVLRGVKKINVALSYSCFKTRSSTVDLIWHLIPISKMEHARTLFLFLPYGSNTALTRPTVSILPRSVDVHPFSFSADMFFIWSLT